MTHDDAREDIAHFGIVAALAGELGSLRSSARATRSLHGSEWLELDLGGVRADVIVCGVGKVAAARAATWLVAHGARRGLCVVGTCGAVSGGLAPGDLVHCARALQVDLAVRAGREVASDPALRAAWERVVPGPAAAFLTADRPVVTPWRRLRLARAHGAPAVADMETAAVAAVAQAAGVPWAALRAVTDTAGFGSARAFRRQLPLVGGRAADTLAALFAEFEGRGRGAGVGSRPSAQ